MGQPGPAAPPTLGVIHTAGTLAYTQVAIESLRRWTPQPYRLVVVDNDGLHHAEILAAGADGCLVPPGGPATFAENANRLLAAAPGDLVLLNNDVLFTPGWFEPLARAAAARPGLISPICNAELPASSGGLTLRPAMRLEEVAGREDLVFQMARGAAEYFRGQTRPLARAILWVCYIPGVVGRALPFDESFVNGAEDDDLSIRAHLAGIPIYQTLDSLILHFGGKSSWDGGEPPAVTKLRLERYTRRMVEKWGPDLRAVMSYGPVADRDRVLRAFGLEAAWGRGEYAACIRALAAATGRS